MVDGKYYFTKGHHHRTNPSSDTYYVECENNNAEPWLPQWTRRVRALGMLFELGGAPLTSVVRQSRKQKPKPSQNKHYYLLRLPETEQNQILFPSLSRKAPIGVPS
jgi:hypothetical protein